MTAETEGSGVVEIPMSPVGFGSDLQWSPDGKRLLLGSIDGVVSVGVTPGEPAVVHPRGELDLEWSSSELSWQPVFR